MLYADFCGGLGNLMFQCASVYGLAKLTGHTYAQPPFPLPPPQHSTMDYSTNILQRWTPFVAPSPSPAIHPIEFMEPNQLWEPSQLLMKAPNTFIMKGYWQRAAYIEPYKAEILSLFTLNPVKPTYATEADNAYFLHVRRGDFVGNSYHELDLRDYYRRGISRMPSGSVAYVVSNDPDWCDNWQELADVRHVIVREDEVDTLSIMAACALGGIAANSSFSWWGLYLNSNRPHLYIPERYFPHDKVYDRGYDFPGSVRLQI